MNMVEGESGVKSPEIGFKSVCGFSVSGCPLWVFKGIAEPANERFNGTYWIRLAELLQLEQAYYELTDAMAVQRELVAQSTIPPQARVKQPEDEEIIRPKYFGQK